MYQGLTYDVDAAIQTVIQSGLMISVCNIYEAPGVTDATGQWDLSNLVPVAGLQGIQCMQAVQTPIRPDQTGVVRTMPAYSTINERHTLLNGYYSAIADDMLAQVDGIMYQIQTVEPDSQHTMTRLALRTFRMGLQ